MTHEEVKGEVAGPDHGYPYRIGGAAALMAVVLTLGEVVCLALYPQPGTVVDWFDLFRTRRIVGLLDFWGLEVPMYVMFAVVFLALYAALGKVNQGRMVIAVVLALLGIGIFLATNNPFTLLTLSNRYAAATTDAERSALLAAGQAVLANTNQRAVGGFNMGLFLVSIAGLVVSWAMYRSGIFGRPTAVMGILANALSLADYARQALTQSAVAALLLILPGALSLAVWYVLVGLRLLRLGSPAGRQS